MKLYLAGIYTSNFHLTGQLFHRLNEREKDVRIKVKHYLESYHYIHRKSYVDRIRTDKVKVFLDSGAFSAFTKGVEIDIKAYCRYIHDNLDIVETVDGILCASVLDGIGDPLKTWQNQMMMEKLGVKPLPCFHYGEDEKYLEWYVNNYDYITLGGMVPISNKQLLYWLDRLWEKYLTDGAGLPRVRVHGFGLTAMSLVQRYPWFSVDSSSWVQAAAMGTIIIPGMGGISVSEHSPRTKIANAHIDNYNPEFRRVINEYLVNRGFSLENLRVNYLARWVFNMWAFSNVTELLQNFSLTFENDQPGLF